MKFPIIIHKDENSCFGVTIPDIPGCFSAGDSVEEAIENTKDAVYSHVGYLLESGQDVDLTATAIDSLMKDPDYQDGIWAFVDVDVEKLDKTPERINISFPKHVLHRIDNFIEKRHESRSGFLARAAISAIAEEARKQTA